MAARTVPALEVYADFSGVEARRLNAVRNLLTLPLRAQRSTRDRPGPMFPKSLASVSRVEIFACLSFVAHANAEAQRIITSRIMLLALEAGMGPLSGLEVDAIYRATIGEFLTIDKFVEGSCKCECSTKRDFRTYLNAFAIGGVLLIGQEGFKESDPGKFIIAAVRDGFNETNELILRAVDAVRQDFPIAALESFEPGYCRVVLCIDPPRGGP